MAQSTTVRTLFAAWDDCDRALSGLTAEIATMQVMGSSSFAWILGHVTSTVDAWINVRFQGLGPHPVISDPDFRVGSSGAAAQWETIQSAVREVRQTAQRFLSDLQKTDLDRVIPYDGSAPELRTTGLCLRDALLSMIAHHYFHIGEVAAKRALLGQHAGDYPTPFWRHASEGRYP